MATLNLPKLEPNPSGWGPCEKNVPLRFKELPYQPFKKKDMIGKVSDWTGNTYGDSRRVKIYNPSIGYTDTMNPFGYIKEDNQGFHLVNDPLQKPMGNRQRRPLHQQNNKFQNQNNQNHYNNRQNNNNNRKRPKWRPWRRQNPPREASIKIEDHWKEIDTFELSNLGKLTAKVTEGEDLFTAGSVKAYNKNFDTTTLRNFTKMDPESFHNKYEFPYVTAMDDPVAKAAFKKLIEEKPESGITVLATDNMISTLMTMSRSIIPWDITAYKHKNQIVFDIEATESGDVHPINRNLVSETCNQNDPNTKHIDDSTEEIDKALKLSEEAAMINQTVSQQVLRHDAKSRVFSGQKRFPFEVDSLKKVPSKLYRYRRYYMDQAKTITMLVRCEVDAYEMCPAKDLVEKGKPNFVAIHSLNEWNHKYSSGIDWKKHLDKHGSTVLATEIKNNSFKMARWIVNAKLANAYKMKLAYVTRDNYRDNTNHKIVNVDSYTPDTLAATAGLSFENCWGVMRFIIDKIMSGKDGDYHILRSPNDKSFVIYRELDDEDSEESGSEESGSEEGSSEEEEN